ncbi:hypothetical protein TYRP_015761 [Tyrophagus putrescentiae]|nr:hypothetical protein TYRP_015761 [Tyrophagus putrescentiae]
MYIPTFVVFLRTEHLRSDVSVLLSGGLGAAFEHFAVDAQSEDGVGDGVLQVDGRALNAKWGVVWSAVDCSSSSSAALQGHIGEVAHGQTGRGQNAAATCWGSVSAAMLIIARLSLCLSLSLSGGGSLSSRLSSTTSIHDLLQEK